MSLRSSHPLWFIAGAALLASAPSRAAAQVRVDSVATDSALIALLKATDPFFRLFVRCAQTHLTWSSSRTVQHGVTVVLRQFTYQATCDAEGQEEDDCLYKVTAEGTLDAPIVPTIRKLRWDLVCNG